MTNFKVFGDDGYIHNQEAKNEKEAQKIVNDRLKKENEKPEKKKVEAKETKPGAKPEKKAGGIVENY